MPTEKGVVIRIDTAATWVKTTPSGACESCASRGACHAMVGGEKEMEVPVLNPVGAKPGDLVVLKIDSSPLLKATFLIYLFPILLLMAGAVAGEWISRFFGWGSSAPAAVLGFGSLAAGLVLVKIVGRRLSQQYAYRPRILRILGQA